jgi:hypothetical protein
MPHPSARLSIRGMPVCRRACMVRVLIAAALAAEQRKERDKRSKRAALPAG